MAAEDPSRHDTPSLVSPGAAGLLLSMLERGLLVGRRSQAVKRLRELSDGNEFASLPDDLQQRICEIVSDREATE